jgi:hypothetical protein
VPVLWVPTVHELGNIVVDPPSRHDEANLFLAAIMLTGNGGKGGDQKCDTSSDVPTGSRAFIVAKIGKRRGVSGKDILSCLKNLLPVVMGEDGYADQKASARGHNHRDWTRIPVTGMPVPSITVAMMPIAVLPVCVVIAVGTMVVAQCA